MTTDDSLLDATAAAELVRSGTASPLELIDAAIARIEKLNPELNAVIHERFDGARREAAAADLAAGPLRGVAVVIKDLHGLIAGEPYHAGCKAAKEAGYRATETSDVVRRLQDAGAIVVGKTNTPEFGSYPTTEPLAYGPSRNPWNTGHSTGGSSGGSGAAVASGMVPIGHANDGGGSIRIPASECGLVGLKPTRGRVPQWPEGAEVWAGLNAEGVVTRTVRDTALALDVLAGPEPGDVHTPPAWARPLATERAGDVGKLRIGVCMTSPDGTTPIQPDVAAVVAAAVRTLEGLGHQVADESPAALNAPDLITHFLPCYSTWSAADLDTWGARLGRGGPLGEDDVEPGTWALAQNGRETTAAQYVAGLEGLRGFARRVLQWWADGWDVLVTPTMPEPPPPLGQFGSPDDPLAGMWRSASIVPFTMPFNVTGQPAMSLPLGVSAEGLPIGVQFVGPFGREDVLVRLGLQLEEAMPWATRRPAVSA